MPWNEPGGNQQDPWSGKKPGSGNNDPEELIRKLNEKLSRLFGGSGGSGNNSSQNNSKGIIFLLIVFVAGWLLSGFYTVDARQQGLVLRFGAHQITTDAGLHWRLPYPIETVEIIDTEQNRSAQDRNIMLTKDENIVEVAVAAQYKVRTPEDYAFNILKPDFLSDQPQGTLYQVMRGITREVIGRNDMDFILREGRAQIAGDIQNQMQQVLDNYGSGMQIITVNLTYAEAPEAVKAAFDEANKAREDANRFQNEAETYANKVIPDARGKAARLVAEAEAFRQETVSKAEGDASRFTQLVAEYRKAPEVTRERLYLDTLETVMAGSRKVMIDSSSNNMLYLPLDQLNNATPDSNANQAATAAAMQSAAEKINTTQSPMGNGTESRAPREAGVRESR